jgi:hypothetical protein
MENNTYQQDWYKTPSRKTLRLTFRLSEGKVSLISHQRLDMICPPVVGDKPEPGRHGGFWMMKELGIDFASLWKCLTERCRDANTAPVR